MEQEKLKRQLGLFPTTNIVVANMIGAGIFTTSGLLMAGLNDPLLMLALWVVGGIIALCGALSYGELGAAMPGAGGEYLFLSKLYNPIFGFLILLQGYSCNSFMVRECRDNGSSGHKDISVSNSDPHFYIHSLPGD